MNPTVTSLTAYLHGLRTLSCYLVLQYFPCGWGSWCAMRGPSPRIFGASLDGIAWAPSLILHPAVLSMSKAHPCPILFALLFRLASLWRFMTRAVLGLNRGCFGRGTEYLLEGGGLRQSARQLGQFAH